MLKDAPRRYYRREKGDNMYIYFNPNPKGTRVGDCAVRAVALATNQDWRQAYIGIALQGYTDCNMPSANTVWGEYLRRHGFERRPVADDTTVARFADGHREGVYVLALPDHVVTIKDGNVYDSWDSSRETVIYYWERINDERI